MRNYFKVVGGSLVDRELLVSFHFFDAENPVDAQRAHEEAGAAAIDCKGVVSVWTHARTVAPAHAVMSISGR